MRLPGLLHVERIDDLFRAATDAVANHAVAFLLDREDLTPDEDVADLRVLVDEVGDLHCEDVSTRFAQHPQLALRGNLFDSPKKNTAPVFFFPSHEPVAYAWHRLFPFSSKLILINLSTRSIALDSVTKPTGNVRYQLKTWGRELAWEPRQVERYDGTRPG
jgi:hypothetical protein